MVLKPTQGSGFSRSVQQKRDGTSPPRFLASHDTGRHQTWRAHAPLTLEPSLPRLRAGGGLCLEVLPGTWEPDLFLEESF